MAKSELPYPESVPVPEDNGNDCLVDEVNSGDTSGPGVVRSGMPVAPGGCGPEGPASGQPFRNTTAAGPPVGMGPSEPEDSPVGQHYGCPLEGAFRVEKAFVSYDGEVWEPVPVLPSLTPSPAPPFPAAAHATVPTVPAAVRAVPDGYSTTKATAPAALDAAHIAGQFSGTASDFASRELLWYFCDVRPQEGGAVYSGIVSGNIDGAVSRTGNNTPEGRPFTYYPGENLLTVDISAHWPDGAVSRYEDLVYRVRTISGGVELLSHAAQWSQEVYLKWILVKDFVDNDNPNAATVEGGNAAGVI